MFFLDCWLMNEINNNYIETWFKFSILLPINIEHFIQFQLQNNL